MAFKTYDDSGKCSNWKGAPSDDLLASRVDVRDYFDDPYPGSRGDRIGHAAGKASERKASGAWPSAALTAASAAGDLKHPDYAAPAPSGVGDGA